MSTCSLDRTLAGEDRTALLWYWTLGLRNSRTFRLSQCSSAS